LCDSRGVAIGGDASEQAPIPTSLGLVILSKGINIHRANQL